MLHPSFFEDEDSLLDQIHVFTINPFRLYITTLESPEVKIIPLDSVLPRSNHGIKSKFSLIPLTGNLSDNLLLHEENVSACWLLGKKIQFKHQMMSRKMFFSYCS